MKNFFALLEKPTVPVPIPAPSETLSVAPSLPAFGGGMTQLGQFLADYTTEHQARIRESAFIVYDLETTGLTMQSSPVRPGKLDKIGGTLLSDYIAGHAGCKVNTQPRCRIVSIQTSDGWRAAFDMDSLSADKQRELISDCVQGQVLIGHNLGFDLAWSSFHAPHATPALVLDSMVIFRAIFPAKPLRVHALAAKGNTDAVSLVQKSSSSHQRNDRGGTKTVGVSLAACAVALGFPMPDKSHQLPLNWSVSILSRAHYDYVLSDVHLPLEILKKLFKKSDGNAVIAELMEKHPHYVEVLSPALLGISRIHQNGLPLDMSALNALYAEYVAEVQKSADALIGLLPGAADFTAQLHSTKSSLPDTLKQVWADYAASNGVTVTRTDDGALSLDSKSAKISGLAGLPAWGTWIALQEAKKRLQLLDDLRDASIPDVSHAGFNRLRSLLSPQTETLRLSSQAPNIQNIPRDKKFRAIIAARPGHSILATDYSQIEMRIAAALAVRAFQECESGDFGTAKPWLKESIDLAKSDKPAPESVKPSSDAEADTAKEWVSYYTAELIKAYRAIQENGMPLVLAFREGLDPHLLTGLAKAVRQGVVVIGDVTPLEFLRGLDTDSAKALKVQISAQRQAAKAMNFGLLYGMSAGGLHEYGITSYGLNWTLAEAELDRDAWFDLYPEVRFWQIWERFTKKMENPADKKLTFNLQYKDRYTKQIETKDVSVWQSSTLAGRPVVALEAKDILNYQDQGTGADMLLSALARLPDSARATVVNLVHDEVVCEVPDAQLEQVKGQVESSMLAAAGKMLEPWGIPAGCESETGRCWS
jgi:DNA polymerase-1